MTLLDQDFEGGPTKEQPSARMVSLWHYDVIMFAVTGDDLQVGQRPLNWGGAIEGIMIHVHMCGDLKK